MRVYRLRIILAASTRTGAGNRGPSGGQRKSQKGTDTVSGDRGTEGHRNAMQYYNLPTTKVNLTGGNRSGLTGYRSNRSGPVPAGTQPAKIQILNLNSKNEKFPKNS